MDGNVRIAFTSFAELKVSKEELEAIYEALTTHVGAPEPQALTMDALTDQISAMLTEWEEHERKHGA